MQEVHKPYYTARRRAMCGWLSDRYTLVFLVASLFICPSLTIAGATPQDHTKPPVARVTPKKLEKHGHVRIDNYYWLRERDDPEVIAYLDAENDYAKNSMAHTKHLQAKLIEEFQNVVDQPEQPVTYRRGDYLYFERFDEGKQYPVYCRKKGLMEIGEEILLDANQLAEGHEVFALADFQVSPGQDILAYGVDTTGDRDFFTFYFRDLNTGKLYPDVISDVHRLTAWANDNKTLYYVRDNRMYSHYLGDDPPEDKFLLEDVSFLYKTKSDKYVLAFSSRYGWDWKGYLDADDPTSQVNKIVPSSHGYQCLWPEHRGDKFYYLNDHRLMEVPVGSAKLEDESQLTLDQEDLYIQHFEVFKDYLVLWEKKKGATRCRIVAMADGRQHYLVFDEPIYSVSDGQPEGLALRSLCNGDFNSHTMIYAYSSPTIPQSVYEYNMVTRERTLVSQENMGPGFDPDNYQSERLWATAKDGTRIPLSLVYRKGIKKDGGNPLILDGYGMYGVGEELGFSPFALSLLNRGFICAIAHVRGGGEFAGWHKQGRLLKKENSFSDFIACAQYLVDQKYTHPDRLFARGESGGGLLVAGVITMAPEVFQGAVIKVPFLDIITTMIDEDQEANIRELGNPNDREYYEYMLSYAPYENIEPREYPSVLITAGFHDTHVYYWPAAKFAAKLRAMKKDDNRLLLKTYMKGGHGGASFSGRLESLRETAYEYAFILDLAGIRE